MTFKIITIKIILLSTDHTTVSYESFIVTVSLSCTVCQKLAFLCQLTAYADHKWPWKVLPFAHYSRCSSSGDCPDWFRRRHLLHFREVSISWNDLSGSLNHFLFNRNWL